MLVYWETKLISDGGLDTRLGALYMITGVRVAERNDQVAGTKGKRHHGLRGTNYGVMMWDIFRKRGK